MATLLTTEEIKTAKEWIAESPTLEGFVPSEGSLTPRFVLVSEAPGATEAAVGHPFQGPAGATLDDWLAKIGVTRDELYLTGAVRARPFSETNGRKRDRKPTSAEIAQFAPLLDHELAALTGRLLVPLGNTGLQRLLGNKLKISQVHGQLLKSPIMEWHPATKRFQPGKTTYSILPLFHPSYIRRFPGKQELVAADLAMLQSIM
ncbi:uracil-DNA glycosylase [Furfurilactobacillus sp. WILCCON 0119]